MDDATKAKKELLETQLADAKAARQNALDADPTADVSDYDELIALLQSKLDALPKN